MSNISESNSDISYVLGFLDHMDDSGTNEVETQEQEGTRLLKAGLENLEKFFSFSSYVKTEKDKDGRKIHMGRAKCEEKTCVKKGDKIPTYSYTTKTRANLRKHYESMHKSTFSSFKAALDGASKRGRWKGREDDIPAQSTGHQMSIEESFSRNDRQLQPQKPKKQAKKKNVGQHGPWIPSSATLPSFPAFPRHCWPSTNATEGNETYSNRSDEQKGLEAAVTMMREKWEHLQETFKTEVAKDASLLSSPLGESMDNFKSTWDNFDSVFSRKDQPREDSQTHSLNTEMKPENTDADNFSDSGELRCTLQLTDATRADPDIDWPRDMNEKSHKKLKMTDTLCPQDHNESFIQSILPFLKRLRPVDNIQCRIKMQEVLLDFVHELNPDSLDTSNGLSDIREIVSEKKSIPTSTLYTVPGILHSPLSNTATTFSTPFSTDTSTLHDTPTPAHDDENCNITVKCEPID